MVSLRHSITSVAVAAITLATVGITPPPAPPRSMAAPGASLTVARAAQAPTIAMATAPAPRDTPLPPPGDGRDAPDPAIVADGGRWALFTTQIGFLNVPVATSDPGTTWSEPMDALPALPDWAAWGTTWAPGVVEWQGSWLLFFAARSEALGLQCIGVARSTIVTGPYRSADPGPVACQPELGGSIDPQPFVAPDGQLYLLWKSDANAIGAVSQLYSARMDASGTKVVGEPVALLASDATWEAPLIENPALVAFGDAFVLLYSGGWWNTTGYATGYGVCASPLGPCRKATIDQPLIASSATEAGTGGASAVLVRGDTVEVVYHAWSTDAVGYENGGARSLRSATLRFDGVSLSVDRRAD